ADPHHENPALEAEHRTGHTEGASPLAGPGFSRQPLNAEGLVIVSLGNRSIGLVGAGRACPFVLVVNLYGSAQGLFEVARADKRRGAPYKVFFKYRLRDVYPALGGDFLLDQVHGKDRGKIIRTNRFTRSGMKRRTHRRGHVS